MVFLRQGPRDCQGIGFTFTLWIMPSAVSPSEESMIPKNSEKEMTPKIFMLTAAATMLSGNALRTTSNKA